MIRHFKDGTPKNTFCPSNLVFTKLNQKNSQQAGLQLSFSESCICPWKLMKQTKCWRMDVIEWRHNERPHKSFPEFSRSIVEQSNSNSQSGTHAPKLRLFDNRSWLSTKLGSSFAKTRNLAAPGLGWQRSSGWISRTPRIGSFQLMKCGAYKNPSQLTLNQRWHCEFEIPQRIFHK